MESGSVTGEDEKVKRQLRAKSHLLRELVRGSEAEETRSGGTSEINGRR
jgi:hypothetical protein